MRTTIAVMVSLIAIALSVCTNIAHRSEKDISHHLALLLAGLIPPVLGNLLIIVAQGRALATLGCYVYFLGMDFVMYALLRFTLTYCRIEAHHKRLLRCVYALLAFDALQLLCNIFFGHAFTTEEIMAYGAPYFRLVPLAGQTFHRIVDYGVFFAVLVLFLIKTIRSPRVYSERYLIIFLSMVVTGLWETFYIFSRTPIDRSMIGFGFFGLLVFYFSLYYRPVRLLDHLLANVASSMGVALFFFDINNNCVWANKRAVKFAGIEDGDFEHSKSFLRKHFPRLDFRTSGWACDEVIYGEDDAHYYHIEKHEVAEASGRIAGSYLSVRDNTQQQRTLQQERYNANHDSLSGIYTKQYLYTRIREELQHNPNETYYVAYMDINNFKMVNDVFGHDFGDHALRCLADSLKANMPEGCLYGRLSGDCFGLFIPEKFYDAKRAYQLLSDFTVRSDNREHRLVIHQGVYKVQERDIDVSVMFDRAHIAQNTIKNEYKRYLAMYNDAMRDQMLWEQQIVSTIGDALAQKQVCPYLQAIVNTQGKVVGAEALVRWLHPTYGCLSPARFVPIIEKNGMIADVDRYMWRCACEILARWQAMGNEELFVSINVSPKDFYFLDVFSELRQIVEEYGVPASRVRVEITETTMMTDQLNRIRILQNLRDAGFVVEMDDFGSGYSSLNMLKDMPADVIKVDMLFLNKTKNDKRSRLILRNIMNMTNDLGILPLTEGVETEDQYHVLVDMGCKLFQGFYFAKPIPVEQFESLFVRPKVRALVSELQV